MRRHYLAGLFISLVAPAGAVAAAETTSKHYFEAGIAAFQSGELESARQNLEQARDGGLASSALAYNLGVVYYRLGHFDLAEREFLRLLDTPHAPLARYNLGLVAQSRGDVAGARQWFTQAASTASTKEIELLARRRLTEDSALQANDRQSSNAAFFSVAAGYDDNIASTPSTESSDETGAFGDLLGSARAYFPESERQGLVLDATAYTRQYPNNASFDTSYLSTGVAWQRALGPGRLDSGVSVTGLWFGGDLLERQVRLRFDYQRNGCFWPDRFRVACKISVHAANASGGSEYESYDGRLYGAAFSAERNYEAWTFKGTYRLDVDRRDDLETEQEFFSLSPTRHRFSLGVDYQLSRLWKVAAEQSIRMSRYADPHRLIVDGQAETETRDDEQFWTTLRASYRLSARWELGMELSWQDNDSSIERYDYDRTEGFVSLDAVF